MWLDQHNRLWLIVLEKTFLWSYLILFPHMNFTETSSWAGLYYNKYQIYFLFYTLLFYKPETEEIFCDMGEWYRFNNIEKQQQQQP